MGVKGLWRKVLTDYEENQWDFEEILHTNSVLLVDAFGFVFHLLDEQVQTMYSQISLKREFGGSYREIEDLLTREIQRLNKKLGFDLIFYFDGPDSYHKKSTAEKRREQLLAKWDNMLYAGLGDGDQDQSDLPLPPLCFQALKVILERYKISIIRSQSEADQKMALDCFNLNDSEGEERFYCYSGDSDFLMMKNCQTIRFGDLDNVSKKLDKGLSVRVWKRATLAKHLGCTELQFVQWAILRGNDFTQHFSHQILGIDEYSDFDELFDRIVDGTIAWHPASIDDESAQQAVLYSFAFYELEDLQPFMLEKYKTVKQLEGLHDVDDGLHISATMKAAIKEWLQQKANSKASFTEISRLAIEFIEVARREDLAKGVSIVQIEHIDALRKMLTALSTKSFDTSFRGSKCQYVDQKVSNFYQLVVREVGKFKTEISTNKAMKPYKPWDCFDGLIFHNLMHDHFISVSKESDLATKLSALMLEAPSSSRERIDSSISSAAAEDPARPVNNSLPTDAYRQQILDQISRDRVTIIHGETGCGKSSRVPVFILEEFEAKKKYCKIMITQPRRIAVVNLKRRLQEQLGDKIGMRMGHGVREESENCKIFFVTTGYLVKLLAYRPEFLSAVTHIIIDEVHERSLDSDLLCWLARQHLSSSNDTRLVLMSATLHTSLYARYFHNNVIMKREPTSLSVGVRRFPVDIHFVEDILLLNDIPKGMKTSLELIKKQCEPPNGSSGLVVPSRLAKIQYDVALALIRVKGKVGSTVLVFVSGITDIVEIQSRFDGLDKYELVAIHSDIPFEEQELALMPPAPDKIKVIVATNAAESSVTLPNLDVVICLGTHKAINFKTGDILRSNLENVWISKSSAIQRAGRTGRIRPGTVYRLYTRELYDSFVDFEEAEIHRKPLHEIILSLKATFQDSHGHSGVIPILSDMLETPDLSKVDECLEYLHEGKMITAPTDMARLTSRGEFAGHLPLDIGLANMVMYGINLGVGPESIVAAAALAQPKSPFRVAHPLVHNDPMEYNEIVRQTFMGALYFDGGMYSDPFMMIRMMVEWLEVDASHQFRFCTHHGLVLTRMKHFVSFANHLFRQVKQLMKGAIDVVGDARRIVSKYADQSEEDDFSFGNIEKHISDSKLNRLRLAMLWAFDHNLIYSRGGKAANTDIDSAINELVVLPSSTLKRNIIEELFPSHLIPQRIDICGKKIYSIPPPFDSVDKIGDGLKELLKHLFVHEDVFFVSSSYSMILPGDANIKEDISLTNQKKKKKKCGSNLRKTSILFAVRNIDRRRQQFINLINKRISPFTTTLVGNIDSSNVAERIPSISIYELKDVDEHVYLDFTSALMHVGGISLHVVSDGTANLLSNDVGISVDTIRSLYPPKLAAVLEEELVNAAVPIKTSDVYERISFLEKSESKHCANESGKQKGGNKKQSGKRENLSSKLNTAEESEVPGRRKLCDDLSLGMRLFNAYCMGQRQKKMMYRQLPETDSTTDAKDEKEIVRPRKVVIGSAQWRAQKSAAKAMTEAAKPTENVEQSSAPMPKPVYEVEQYSRKPVLSAWKIMSGKWVSDKKNDADNNDEVVNVSSVPLSRFFAVGKWDDVVMSTRSVVSTSCHGPFPHQPPPCPVLFGVAYSAVTLGSNVVEKLNNVIVEGVTIFPVGSDWIDRALFCMGKCLNQDFEMNLDNNPSVGCMSHHQMCRFIQRLVSMGMDHSIDYDGMLIHAVDLLFADYLTPSDHEWTAEDAERVSNHFRKLVRNFNEKKFLTNADTRQVSKHSTSVANHQSRIAIIAEKRTAFQRAKVAQSESSNVIANVVKKKINNSKRDKSKKTKKENPIFQPQGGTLSKKGKKEKASEKKNKPK